MMPRPSTRWRLRRRTSPSPSEERPVGGLGIYLVRQIMDGLEYRRQDGKNCLVMKKKITAA